MALHPVLASMVEADRLSGRPAMSDGSVAQARALIAQSCAALGPGPAIQSVQDIAIKTRSGAVAGRLYRSQETQKGLIVYLHGGGWLAGTLDGSDALARHLALRSGCALMLVDYRLAPEHPFPAGLEDAEDALRWARLHGAELAGADLPLIVAGDSAGANLATVVAAALGRELGLALQLLFYPITDTDTSTESYLSYGTGLRLTGEDMRWFLRHYAPVSIWPDERISPLRRKTLKGSPPAWIATAEYDVLRDEGEAYAQRLKDEGVQVVLRCYPGLTHGFARMMNKVDTADRALDDAAAAIVAHCKR